MPARCSQMLVHKASTPDFSQFVASTTHVVIIIAMLC